MKPFEGAPKMIFSIAACDMNSTMAFGMSVSSIIISLQHT
jgi:hypothetical protein